MLDIDALKIKYINFKLQGETPYWIIGDEFSQLIDRLQAAESKFSDMISIWEPVDEFVRPLTKLGYKVSDKALELLKNGAIAQSRLDDIDKRKRDTNVWQSCLLDAAKNVCDSYNFNALSFAYHINQLRQIVADEDKPAPAEKVQNHTEDVLAMVLEKLNSIISSASDVYVMDFSQEAIDIINNHIGDINEMVEPAQAVAIPEDYKPVPIEPTDDMLCAGANAAFKSAGEIGWLKKVYQAILSAAPSITNETKS
jgi:hypothetical protein